MTDFVGRMNRAESHETAVMSRLADSGWTVCAFGQAQIEEHVREELKQTGSWLRWLPDVLAVCGKRVLLIDAKSEERTDTPNYAIEKRSLDSHLRLGLAGEPVVYAWDDFRVCFAGDVNDATKTTGPDYGNGSGTPYWLVRKDDVARPWEAIFGPLRKAA